MIKRGLLTMSLVGVALLAACGPSYDKEIEQVLKLENKSLDKPTTKTNIEELTRENAKLAVYNEGDYIQIVYMIRPDYQANVIYESTDNGYEVIVSSDLRDKLEGMEPDYTVNMEEDS